jgi:hypothetical protein
MRSHLPVYTPPCMHGTMIAFHAASTAVFTFLVLQDGIANGFSRDPIVWTVVDEVYSRHPLQPTPAVPWFFTSKQALVKHIAHHENVPSAVKECRTFVISQGANTNEAIATECWAEPDELDQIITLGKEINNTLLQMLKDTRREINAFIKQ